MPRSLGVALTATGLVTSVGHTAAAACAAIRAGVTRPRGTRELSVLDLETQDTVPLLGHPVHLVTEGFHKTGRWMCLSRICLGEMIAASGVPRGASHEFWGRAALVAVTRELDSQLFPIDDDADLRAHVTAGFLRPLCRAMDLPIAEGNIVLMPVGSVGMAEALTVVAAQLESNVIDRAIIVGVDSWFDPVLIGKASSMRRLKTADVPVGFVPGEAAACVLVETVASARRRRASILGAFDGMGVGRELGDPIDSPRALGSGLTAALANVLEQPPAQFRGDLVLDLNGESWRAQQWGVTAARLGQRLAHAKVHLPCVSIGDIGAASGPVGVCMALEAFRRGWARTDSALVVTNSDTGGSACMRIARGSA